MPFLPPNQQRQSTDGNKFCLDEWQDILDEWQDIWNCCKGNKCHSIYSIVGSITHSISISCHDSRISVKSISWSVVLSSSLTVLIRHSIISASLYERSAIATGVSPGPSVCPHMWAVATYVDGFLRCLGWWVRSGSEAVYQILVVIVEGEGAVWGWIKCKNGVLIDYRLVCEKLTIFPYAECTMEFCAAVAFLWYTQVQDRSGGWCEIHLQKHNSKHASSFPNRATSGSHIGLAQRRRQRRQHSRAVRNW